MPSLVPVASDPLSPWAWLPSSLAGQLEVARYVSVATLAAYTWDWLVSLGQEYRMLSRLQMTFPLAVYFLSRIVTMATVICIFVFLACPVPDCDRLITTIGCLMAALSACTSTLFLLRILAIFHGQRVVIGLFALLWLAVVGSATIVPLSVHGIHIGTTSYCAPIDIRARTGAYGVMVMVDRLFVFLFISWSLTKRHNSRLKAFIQGHGLPSISKLLLSGGQLYYFTNLGMNIANLVFLFSTSLPGAYQVMLMSPTIALESTMACRVFRQLRCDSEQWYDDSPIGGIDLPNIELQHSSRGLQFRRTEVSRSTVVEFNSPSMSSDVQDKEFQAGTCRVMITKDVHQSV